MKLRVFEAFAGYGSQSIALRNIGVEHDVVAISEIDKYALQAYYAIHDKNIPNLGDISKIKVKDIPEHDLFTYSFPCQDISVAGKQNGIEKGKTRSGLLYECERIIEGCKPKYLLLENVKNLVGKKFKAQFDEWLAYLESLGYTNYWQVLNAKDYGVPQNRERVFVISIHGKHKPYEFPKKFKLDKCIGDILEDNVDDKYYMDKPFRLVNKGHQAELDMKGMDCIKRVYGIDNVSPALTTMQGGHREPKILCERIYQDVRVRKYEVDIEGLKRTLKESKNKSKLTCKEIAEKLNVEKTTVEHWFRSDDCFSIPDEDIWLELKKIINIDTDEFDESVMEFVIKPNEYDLSNRVYHENGISPTLTCMSEGTAKKILINKEPKIICERRYDEGLRFFKGNVCGTIRTIDSGGDKRVIETESNFRIRKLTPRECFRLMGMNDKDIDKIQALGISNSQQYKMAGNSIVINVLEEIFKNLFDINN